MKETYSIKVYKNSAGRCPYTDWECRLSRKIRGVVSARLIRLRLGMLGDYKVIKGAKGLYELRLHIEAGYRIYFGKEGEKIILLLLGGTKGSQKKDIQRAKKYWMDYKDHQERK